MASAWARQLHEFRYPGQGLGHHNRSFCCGWFLCTIALASRVEDCLGNEDSRLGKLGPHFHGDGIWLYLMEFEQKKLIVKASH